MRRVGRDQPGDAMADGAPPARRGGAQHHPEPRVLPGRRRVGARRLHSHGRRPLPLSSPRRRRHRESSVPGGMGRGHEPPHPLELDAGARHDPRGARRAARHSRIPHPCRRAGRGGRLRDEERALSPVAVRRWRASSAAPSSGSATGARICSRARRRGTRTSRPSWDSIATVVFSGSARRCGLTWARTRSIHGRPASR